MSSEQCENDCDDIERNLDGHMGRFLLDYCLECCVVGGGCFKAK